MKADTKTKRHTSERGMWEHAVRDKREREARQGARRMPWHLQAKKDVVNCEKLRGAVKQAEIRRYPNGATQYALWHTIP